MMKNLLMFVFIIFFFSSSGQESTIGTDTTGFCSLKGNYYAGSDLVHLSTLKALYNSGFIERKTFTDGIKFEPEGRYHAGAEAATSFLCMFPIRDSSWINGFELSDRQIFAVQFNRDAYDLIFKGNQQFDMTGANLSDTDFKMFRYQQLKYHFGYLSKDRTYFVKGYLGYIKGEQYSSFEIEKGSLGLVGFESLKLEAKGRIASAGDPGLGQWNGNGVGAGIEFQKTIKKLVFNVYLKDFGYVKWPVANIAEIDTTITWSGIDLFNQSTDTSLSNALTFDPYSLIRFKYKEEKTFVPATSGLYACYKFNDARSLSLRMEYYHFIPLKPSGMITYNHPFSDKFSISPVIGYGGTTNFFYGTGIKYNNNSWGSEISIMNPEGWIIPDISKFSGLGFNVFKLF